MSERKKCAHESCRCMTDKTYCSEVCEDSKHVTDIACQCGHASCEASGMNA